jgi:arylformamidase
MMLYDITRTISTETAVWPGDTPYSYVAALELEAGASVNLMTVTLSPHTGTHADAYFHYELDGEHPAGMPLAAYVGPAHVFTVMRHDGPLGPDDFPGLADVERVERLLIHSHVSDVPDDVFPTEFPYLSEELVAWLAAKGTKLVGLDSPSVDALESKTLPCHHALRKHGMVNLELLQLRDVPDGLYELVALPLRLDGVCASPVRAILRAL